ncbi:MAG: ABC transporter ATP-binding protein, partial [Elusimicrobia bacterium]|nr:ABC transporter ATP-binding protein [Elusimicrobiota bacterium]
MSKSYGSGAGRVPVLRGLEMTVAAGEFVAVLGPSGSGKSTLLNLLGLMDRPDEGELRLGGTDVARLSDDERALLRNERLGFVFQFDSLLPEFTMLENVLMPWRIAAAAGRAKNEPREAEARARELLASLGLERLHGRFPSQASGGERQRVAICRALINNPTLLLAD